MEVFDAIVSRRSVRSFLKKAVEDEKLTKVLDAGRWGPTAGNSQEWRFIVVTDQSTKFQIAEASLGQFWMTEAPVLIVVCAKYDIIGSIYGDIGKNVFAVMDCAAAMQNIMLTAFSEGLGSCLVASFDVSAINRILRIPENVAPMGVIALGYPAEKPVTPTRKGLESIVFFGEYGKTWIKGLPGARGPIHLRRDEILF